MVFPDLAILASPALVAVAIAQAVSSFHKFRTVRRPPADADQQTSSERLTDSLLFGITTVLWLYAAFFAASHFLKTAPKMKGK